MVLEKSGNYTVVMDGEELPVYSTSVGDYVIVCFKGEKELVISMGKPFESVAIRPTNSPQNTNINGSTLTLKVNDGDRISVEPYGLENPLFVLCAQPVEKPEHATHVFSKDTVTDVGTLELSSNDCVYIEEGAV